MAENYFGADVAVGYDASAAALPVEPVVDFLVAHTRGGRALELATGTGRIALPLAARGVEVHGIELSEEMVAQLRAKPGGDGIAITMGDMASTRVEGTFALVYLVFNTIMNLTTQDAQVACFENAAAHLHAGGRFVVEVGVPQLRRVPPGETIHMFSFDGPERFGFDEYDFAPQGLVSHHVRSGRVLSIPFRYVWPAELDLMARIAGLRLVERWSGWERQPFTSESTSHVSVWER